jgi:hypothetical protein
LNTQQLAVMPGHIPCVDLAVFLNKPRFILCQSCIARKVVLLAKADWGSGLLSRPT